MRGVLAALAHAHAHEVVHRALNPTTILIGRDGRVSLTGFDFARTGTDRSHTIAEQIVDDLDTHYLAPECHDHPEAASPASDVFATGLVFYALVVGEKPFADAADLRQRQAVFPERPASQVAELPDGMRAWLQALCAFTPRARPSAAEALAELDRLVTARRQSPPPPQNGDETICDYHNLPKGYALTRKYVVQERLGKPGAFGVVYKVKEYRTLRNLPPHEHVVQVIEVDFLLSHGGRRAEPWWWLASIPAPGLRSCWPTNPRRTRRPRPLRHGHHPVRGDHGPLPLGCGIATARRASQGSTRAIGLC
jgi:hypothetical protein